MNVSRVRSRFRHLLKRADRGVVLLLVLMVTFLISRLSFIPFYDGALYYNCIQSAATSPFRLENFNCFGHWTAVYIFLLSFSQYIDAGNLSLLYLVNILLVCCAVLAFRHTLQRLFPRGDRREFLLLSAVFAFNPVSIVHLFHINVDTGVMVFSVLFLAFLVSDRYWLAVLFGAAMIFSKEVGLPFFCGTVALYAVQRILWQPGSMKMRVRFAFRLFPLCIPLLISISFVVLRHLQGIPLFWVRDSVGGQFCDLLFSTHLSDQRIRLFYSDIFLLNFQWVFTAIIAFSLLAWVMRLAVHAICEGVHGVVNALPGRSTVFLGFLLILAVYIVTRVPTFLNARYTLLAITPLLLFAYPSLQFLLPWQRARRVILAVVCVLIFLSNVRTIDPVSKAVYGTIPFGKHKLLDRGIRDSQGLRDYRGIRDQWFYNMEAMHLFDLTAAAMKDMHISRQTVIVIGHEPFWLPQPVDEYTLAPTLRRDGSFSFRVTNRWEDVLPENLPAIGSPQIVYFIEYPNSFNNAEILANLQRLYPHHEMFVYEQDGYRIRIFAFSTVVHPALIVPSS